MTSSDPYDEVRLLAAVAELATPAYILDRDRRIRWLNRAAVELLGDKTGQSFCRIVAPEHVAAAQTQFARKILQRATEPHKLTLLDRRGKRTEVSVISTPLPSGARGVFGVMFSSGGDAHAVEPSASASPELTPRQLEILRLLAQGLDTKAIAEHLGIVQHTVRNHMRGLFRELRVHSRLHAVARGYAVGVLDVDDARA